MLIKILPLILHTFPPNDDVPIPHRNAPESAKNPMACPPSTSQPSPALQVDESNDFLPWLELKAGAEISSALSNGKSAYGASLFASKSITAGDCVLKVPYSVQLAPDNLVPELKDLLSDGVGDAAKLATVVLFEQRMGNDSGWAPYIRWLPRPEGCIARDDELELIRQSSVYQETINQRFQIKKEFLVIRTALKNFLKVSKSITYNYKDFMHVYALVTSRAWGSTKGYSLVIADCNYAPGEQVLIRYRKFSNATLLLDFGFTLSYNIYDQVSLGFQFTIVTMIALLCWENVEIQVNIPHHDVLREMEWELLKRHHRPIGNDVNGFDSSMDSFTINSREIEAHQMLSKLTQLAEDCDASIKFSSYMQKTFYRRQMVRDLLNGELRILKSASALSRSPVRRERSLERRSRSPHDSRSPKRCRASLQYPTGGDTINPLKGGAHKSGVASPRIEYYQFVV
ncbi:hypothetical protein DVH24_023197 [Malus domestica]|uniref:SET domain-containing protein n=1 Tax=Malus domestica TaxID=3750 RepID=A0A498KVU3_MALDO|nr:hypothetical protein DVH24_023197 [Malus domestica]